MNQEQWPRPQRSMREQLLSGGRAHPLLGWIVIGIGVGAAIGSGEGNDMGSWVGGGALVGFLIGIAILRATGGRTLFGRGKDEPPR